MGRRRQNGKEKAGKECVGGGQFWSIICYPETLRQLEFNSL